MKTIAIFLGFQALLYALVAFVMWDATWFINTGSWASGDRLGLVLGWLTISPFTFIFADAIAND